MIYMRTTRSRLELLLSPKTSEALTGSREQEATLRGKVTKPITWYNRGNPT